MSEDSASQSPIPVIVHLSGRRRGTTQRLRGDLLQIGTEPTAEIHVAHEPTVASRHAVLLRRGQTYRLRTDPEHAVWVNGQPVEGERPLASGDVLEIGRDGPILRFRLYPPGSRAYKTPAEAFSDSIDSARHSGANRMARAAALLKGTPRELATQTSVVFRALMVVMMIALVAVVGLLTRNFARLEDRLAKEELRIEGLKEFFARSQEQISTGDLSELRSEIDTALDRVEALEARTDAPARIVAKASRSVVFLQGAYGFVDPRTGRPLRFAGIGTDGLPLRGPDGSPIVGIGGEGPPLQAMFTGTAFVATENGLLLTNRHVALPWDYDEAANMIRAQGFRPVMQRFQGFLPHIGEPFVVQLVAASPTADLAVLACSELSADVAPLDLAYQPPSAGDEVLVLGYPTGIRALLARADPDFIEELAAGPPLDFWGIARRLAVAGHIAPLASRGIVAQVTSAVVVYDAETTRGGSGGPVLDFDGRVAAVTSAVVPEFGGSNLGVPASMVDDLLRAARLSRLLPVLWR